MQTQSFGGHADEIETSIMLAIDETLVRKEYIKAGMEVKAKGPLSRADQTNPNYCPTGVMGDPINANIEKGEKLLDAMLKDVSAYLEKILS